MLEVSTPLLGGWAETATGLYHGRASVWHSDGKNKGNAERNENVLRRKGHV